MLPACHALERIIVHGHYLIPQYFSGKHRMVYDDWRLALPGKIPPYSPGELWVVYAAWAKQPPQTAPSAPTKP